MSRRALTSATRRSTPNKGYSLEHLRDLELVRLTSEEALDGHYLHHAVQSLFRLVRDGFDGAPPGGGADLHPEQPLRRPGPRGPAGRLPAAHELFKAVVSLMTLRVNPKFQRQFPLTFIF